MTEFGYETDPPDPFSGINPLLQAEYINVGDYLAYKDPRVIANTQFLLRDVEPVKGTPASSKRHWFTYQSGLVYANGKPKPSAQAYALPLVITGKGTDSVGQQGVSLWGWLRFLPLITPDSKQQVYIQFRPAGASDYSTIGSAVDVTNPLGFFETVKAVPGPGTFRAVWIEQISRATFFSRDVTYAG
jgi:hypothetical protein